MVPDEGHLHDNLLLLQENMLLTLIGITSVRLFQEVHTKMLPNPLYTEYRLSHTIYWKSPISVLGTSGYEI